MHKARERRIEIIRKRLLRKSTPRIQVSLILALTALAGFLTSFSLLHLGVTWMWLRYPMAVSIAYCVFLLLLALWLRLQRRSLDIDPSILDFIPSGPTTRGESFQFGGGGDFGGGGAGGSWGQSASSPSSGLTNTASSSTPGGLDLDLDELWLIVLAVVALMGGLIASLYIIYIAPALLSEILVDGVLMAGLYRRVKDIEQRHWLSSAASQTFVPAVLVALFVAVAGFALQNAFPEAHTIGDIWNHIFRS